MLWTNLIRSRRQKALILSPLAQPLSRAPGRGWYWGALEAQFVQRSALPPEDKEYALLGLQRPTVLSVQTSSQVCGAGWAADHALGPLSPVTERSIQPDNWEFRLALPQGKGWRVEELRDPKVVFVVCNIMSGSNFSRSCKGEWKRGQGEFKSIVLQTEAGGRGQKNQPPPLLSDGRAQRYRMNLWK